MNDPDPKRLTDDEFEELYRRNLERLDEPQDDSEISYGGNGRIEELLDGLDELDDLVDGLDDDATPAVPIEHSFGGEQTQPNDEQTTRADMIRNALKRYGPGGTIAQVEYEKYCEALAARERQEYRDRIRSEEGRDVRRTLRTPEARAERRAECERERYAQKKGAPVRSYTKLSDMTETERADHKRKQAQLRQQKRRAAMKSKKEANDE